MKKVWPGDARPLCPLDPPLVKDLWEHGFSKTMQPWLYYIRIPESIQNILIVK